MRTKRVGECTWIVVDLSHCFHDKVRDGFQVLAIEEEVGRDSGRPRNRKAAKFNPFAGLQFSDVQPYIWPAGLTSLRNGEVVLIGGKVADPVEGGCRSVRDDSITDRAFPSWNFWSELQPGSAESQMVGRGSTCEAVHTLRNPLKDRSVGREAF